MSRYRGDKGQPDKIVGGGSYVTKHKTGHEVCNFLPAKDGLVYGHVETIKGNIDRQIQQINHIGADKANKVDGVTVVWTATHPEFGRGHVVGWYRNATVSRSRIKHGSRLSKQHTKDQIFSYIASTSAENATCLSLEDRTLKLPASVRPGQTPWRAMPAILNAEQTNAFEALRRLMKLQTNSGEQQPLNNEDPKSGGTSKTSYVRYVESYETKISPEHNNLQKAFKKYLQKIGYDGIKEDVAHVDIRFESKHGCQVLVEVKPCTILNARYAIRTAMGQLLDYQQRQGETCKLIVVTQVKPNKEDWYLLKLNGFGLAYPDSEKSFKMYMPQ